jgi:transcriptional regulator with XRE-family HTH domain
MNRPGNARATEDVKEDGALARSRAFGQLLRALRASHCLRASGGDGAKPRHRPSASALVARLQKAGYPLSGATYSEIENGLSFPRDAAAFIDAVAACLGLSEDEKRSLQTALAYDVVYTRLGEYARLVLSPAGAAAARSQHASVFGLTLKQCREQEELTTTELARRLVEAGLPPPGKDAHLLDREIGGKEGNENEVSANSVTWLAARIERIESATVGEPWPLGCGMDEFITQTAQCLARGPIAEAQLMHAAILDVLAQL